MTALNQDYEKAGFGGTLAFGKKPALILVDLCRAYLDKTCPLYAGPAAQSALEQARLLRQATKSAGFPIVFTRVEYQADGADGGVFFKKVPALKHFVKGHPMAAFDDRLSPERDETVITKQYPSAFFGTALAPMLTSQSVDTVIIAGYSTSGCVRATALDAMQFGFVPFVVSDACADRAEAPHQSNLFDLGAKYAEIVTTENVIQRLSNA